MKSFRNTSLPFDTEPRQFFAYPQCQVGNWVQQNHDRLSQKAGFPQEKLNEINGAWGDNKNCVKMMDDNLRRDLIDWLGESAAFFRF